jgi:hypothetical protein
VVQRMKAIDPGPAFFPVRRPRRHAFTPTWRPKEWLDKFKGQFDMGWDPLSRDDPGAAEEARRRPA